MSLTSRNVSAVKLAEGAFYSDPKSCKTRFGTTTAKRQLLRTHYIILQPIIIVKQKMNHILCKVIDFIRELRYNLFSRLFNETELLQ